MDGVYVLHEAESARPSLVQFSSRMHSYRTLVIGGWISLLLWWMVMPNILFSLGWGSSAPKVIYVIRHGEKRFDEGNHSDYDYACLSEKGWARAYNLKSLFGSSPTHPFRTPQALYSASYANTIDCREGDGWYRTQATIAPLADLTPGGLGLVIDNTTGWLPHLCRAEERGDCNHNASDPLAEPHGFGMCCNMGAAAKMKAKLAEPGVGTILVVWEHANIHNLVHALGVPFAIIPNWEGSDFDSVWELTFDGAGQRFLQLQPKLAQGFSGVGRTWLGPSSGCGNIAPAGFSNRG